MKSHAVAPPPTPATPFNKTLKSHAVAPPPTPATPFNKTLKTEGPSGASLVQRISFLSSAVDVEDGTDPDSGEDSSFDPRTTAPGSTEDQSAEENIGSRMQSYDQDSGNDLRKSFKPVAIRCSDCTERRVVFDSVSELKIHARDLHGKRLSFDDERGMGTLSSLVTPSSTLTHSGKTADASAASASVQKQSQLASKGSSELATSFGDAINQPRTTTNQHTTITNCNQNSLNPDAMEFRPRGNGLPAQRTGNNNSHRGTNNSGNNHGRAYPTRRSNDSFRHPASSYLPPGIIPVEPGKVIPQLQQTRDDSLQGVYARYYLPSSHENKMF
jgi:hypothetical protein